jgi:2-polyprenyl-3-methyl-5-hydroxy-6-metoxy-1,4-benzoquinol methylase
MRSVATSALGYDISGEALMYATDNYGSYFRQVDLDKDIPDTPADVVVTFETIEHLQDPQKFIEWAKSVAPTVIGSIPLNCPTEYHKHNFSCQQAMDFIFNNFKNAKIFYQDDFIITPDIKDPKHGMILFVGTDK